MKKSILLFFCLVGLIGNVAFAQSREVSGKVTAAADGFGIPGANVVVKGTTQGTITDIDGSYRVTVPEGYNTIVFSFIGYSNKEVNIDGQSVINVQLEEDIKQLSEVVVVGYGEQDRKTLTSSIVSVDAKSIENVPMPSPDQLLQGRAAGVQVTANSGEPGGGMMVRVRGSTSIGGAGASDPLYVIDGVPIVAGNLAQTTFGQPTNALADLNPADIASMEILKDASATAIYGARAANGVVLITTKRGKTGDAKISINAYAGTSSAWKDPNELRVSGPDFERLQNESKTNNWIDKYGSATALDGTGNPLVLPYANPDAAMDTNWLDEIFQNGSISNIDVSASGGEGKIQYMVSGSNFSQEGLIRPAKFERTSGRLNLDFLATDKLKFGTSMMYSTTTRNRSANGNDISGSLTTAFFYPSDIPIYNPDGTYNKPIWENPVAVANETDYTMNTKRLIGSIYGEYEIMPGLAFRSAWSMDNNLVDEYSYANTKLNAGKSVNGSATNNVTRDNNWINENILTYQFNLNNTHNFNLLAGNTLQESVNTLTRANGQQFPGDAFKQISSAAVQQSRTDETSWGISSFFTRVNYDLNKKYMLTLNVRADASSRFGKDNQWGTFPSIALGWRVSDESFMSGINAINDLKLRASYGATGNQNGLNNFQARGLWGGQAGGLNGGGGSTPLNNTGAPAAYGDAPGFIPNQLENPNLKWETTYQFNIGFDLAIIQNKVNVSLDYYNKQTKDLLLAVPVPLTTGYSTLFQNYGEMENKGLELAINATPVNTPNLRWDVNFNISGNRNKVTKIPAPFNQFTRDYVRVEEGFPLFSFYVHEQLGVDPQTGNIIWNTGDDETFQASTDRFIGGNAQPDFVGGLTNTLNWKNFDFTALLQFSYGNSILNYNRYFFEHGGERTTGYSSQQLDRWQQPGDITDIPRMSNVNYNTSFRPSRHVEDGSYLRMKNISLGYTVPTSIASKAGMSRLRFYVSSQNLFTITNYTGLDPESTVDSSSTVSGTDLAVMPQPRVLMGGVNITF
ncbi:MAG TPA: TonB-dependent receptor [Cyclobacteriaceae bacterium]|nr:TonB-dependent receptor [Cyclobacteriaceae bacterium]